MRQHSSSISIFAIACGLLAGATPALAAAETWVSGTGTDGGTCQISAPCRTFAFAHTQTNNGSINVLTSGNFGPLTITKPISIVAQGVEAVINSGASGAGIIVQAPLAAIVSLRGLTIDMRGTANQGISFVSGAALHVHNTVIRKTTDGIFFSPASGNSELYVADTVIADNGNGIWVNPTGSGGAKVVLDRVRVENGSNLGIFIRGNNTTGSITATVRDSVAAGNIASGINAQKETAGGSVNVMIDRSASVNNSDYGIVAGSAGATIRIGDSTVTGNGTGLLAVDGGVIASYGTNKVNGNTNDGSTPTPVAMK